MCRAFLCLHLAKLADWRGEKQGQQLWSLIDLTVFSWGFGLINLS